MPAPAVLTVDAWVVENRDLGGGHSLLRMRAPDLAAAARPGQFVNVAFPGRTDPLLPRPFAVFDARADEGEMDVFFKAVGRGTRLLAGLEARDRVRLVGPLGRGWRKPGHDGRVPSNGAYRSWEGVALLVAGGTAYAALHFLAKDLVARGQDVRVIWGQACEASFPDRGPIEVQGAELRLATDDGSCGLRGTSVDCTRHLVEVELARNGTLHSKEPDHRENEFPDPRPALFGAGPVPMLRALTELARTMAIPCQVSLEARMACGIGVCRGCVVNAREPHPGTGLRRRAVCADGPVFDADELDWEDLL